MTTEAKKFKIGLFVMIGMTILILGIIGLGASKFFSDTRTYVTFFSETVRGLEPDSMVRYRGIPIGRVFKIRIAPDGKLAEVVMKIDADVKIEPDMCIKISFAGITGMKYLEIDRKPPDKLDSSPKLDFRPRHPVIPSSPSDVQEILAGVEKIVNNIKALDIKGISERLKASLDNLQALLSKERWAAAADNIEATTASLKNATHRIDVMLQKPGVEDALADAAATLDSLKKVAVNLKQELDEVDLGAQVRASTDKLNNFLDKSTLAAEDLRFIVTQQEGNIFQILENLRLATEAMANLAASLQANPSLLLAEPPPQKQ